jgi:hypothetical protein
LPPVTDGCRPRARSGTGWIGRRVAVLAIVCAVLGATSGRAHEGWGIVVHDQLGVVVADIPGNCIWRIDDGRVEPLLRNVHSHDLELGADDAIYGSNPEPGGNLSSVWRVDAAGRFSYVLPPAPASPLGLQSFLLASDGSIYSANRYDHRRPAVVLLRRRPSGGIAPASSARFTGIDGMTEAPDGTLLLADGAYLRTINRDGEVATVAGPLTWRRWDEDLLGISSVRGDAVHVADHAGRRILRVDWTNGQVREVERSSLFWAPAGVEQRQDDLYILEHLRPPLAILGDLQVGPYLRVRQVVPGGTARTLALIWGRRTAPAAAVVVAILLALAFVVSRRSRVRALVLLVALTGCYRHDAGVLREAQIAHAGAAALDCGDAPPGTSTPAVESCMATAFSTRRPFHARLWKRGVDSQIASGVALDPSGTLFLYRFDNSPCGDPGRCAPTVEELRCEEPYVWTGPSGQHLACTRPPFNQPAGSPNGTAERELPLRAVGDVKPATLRHRVEADFEACAREGARMTGAPVVEAVVGPDGSVQHVNVVNAVNPCYDRALIEALKQWRFDPGTLHGRPVPTIYGVTANVHFR